MKNRNPFLFLLALATLLLGLAAYSGRHLATPAPVDAASLVVEPAMTIVLTATASPSPSPTRCPQATPEPLWVEPVLSPTDLLTQTLTITLGNGEVITVTSPAGSFVAQAQAATLPRPATVVVGLAPNTSNPLLVAGRVRVVQQDGCTYGGYTLTTDRDRLGNPLIIQQGTITPTMAASPSATATPTMCPQATPEPLWVEPVLSPTELLTQTLTVTLGNGEAITVTSPAGSFVVRAQAATLPQPATVVVGLAPNTLNPLLVEGKVRRVESSGCPYGGYTLTTDRDRLGNPLVIQQRGEPALYLPLLRRGE